MSITVQNELRRENMKDLYGYKEKDVSGFLQFIKENPALSKSRLFYEYAKKVKKAQGTVRNMYYAMVKAGVLDVDVKKITPFDSEEERKLIKDVIRLKRSGKSVRKAVLFLAGGDAKKALRYQNKYRNALSVKPQLVREIEGEIDKEMGKSEKDGGEKVNFNGVQLKRLKKEIDLLVERISQGVRKENDYLKSRVTTLERENERLLFMVYGEHNSQNAIKKFYLDKGKDILN